MIKIASLRSSQTSSLTAGTGKIKNRKRFWRFQHNEIQWMLCNFKLYNNSDFLDVISALNLKYQVISPVKSYSLFAPWATVMHCKNLYLMHALDICPGKNPSMSVSKCWQNTSKIHTSNKSINWQLFFCHKLPILCYFWQKLSVPIKSNLEKKFGFFLNHFNLHFLSIKQKEEQSIKMAKRILGVFFLDTPYNCVLKYVFQAFQSTMSSKAEYVIKLRNIHWKSWFNTTLRTSRKEYFQAAQIRPKQRILNLSTVTKNHRLLIDTGYF